MKNRLKSNLPARLARGRQRFENWRTKHKTYHRLPEYLWSAAAKLAGEYGLNRTAHALRLDYSGLKKRMESVVVKSSLQNTTEPRFIQLLPSELTTATECAIECHHVNGTTLRIHLKGQLPDLATLSRSLLSSER